MAILLRAVMQKIRSNLIIQIKRLARFFMRISLRLGVLKLLPRNPHVLENQAGCAAQGKQRLCVFASFSGTGEVAEYVFHNLSALKATGFDVIFVTTAAKISAADLARLSQNCLRVLRRKNTGYDFGSWKAGLFYAGIDLLQYKQLILTNDSYYGPVYPWAEALAKADTDLYGITDSYGIAYHLMSYFVLYNAKILHSQQFRSYWLDVRMIPTVLKTLIIYAYEVGLSQKFQKDGFSISAYCPEKSLFDTMPESRDLLGKTIIVHRFWRELIENMHCPILKVDVFWRVLDAAADTSWRKTLQDAGYEVALIEQHRKGR